MSNYQFRPMIETDLATVYQIEQRAHISPWHLDTLKSCIAPRYYNWVVLQQQQVIGYIFAQSAADEISLLNICIDPDFQGKGIATQLLQQWESGLADSIQFIWLEVRVSNANAIKLYEKFDFIEQGIRKGYYPSAKGREDALVMVKSL